MMRRFQRDRSKKVPILGIEGVGKSSVLFTLAQYVSVNHFGHLIDDPDQVMARALSMVMLGEPIPATMKDSSIRLTINRIPNVPPEESHVHVELTCNDIPGIAFKRLLEQVRTYPNYTANRRTANLPKELAMFCTLLQGCSGLLILVDLIRDRTVDEFHINVVKSLNTAFSEQVAPIMVAINLASNMNGGLANMPVYFVFTKGDIHGVPSERINSYFNLANAIQLRQLHGMGASVRTYHVKAAGWPIESDLGELGFAPLLTDLLFALRSDKS